ncbi:MAG: magnesium protoporphyrin IX methyltransferase [Candidatus Baltobacteraceae bacterium]|jgi:magnesium-protoporphyrin O-methyltransferase
MTESTAQRPLPYVAPAPGLFEGARETDTSKRVRKYFETSGFSRWTAIYGTGDIPPIWKVIRDGHHQALETVVSWVATGKGHTALDAGCGTGNLAVALANHGFEVDAFDISPPMIHFAKYINHGRTKGIPPRFIVGDIATLAEREQRYDVVCCLDVLFHYPYEEVAEMLRKLAALSTYKLVGSFAIRTPMNDFWMKVGYRFHSRNRMTRLFMLSYDEVEQILYRAGYRMTRRKRIKFFFYDSFVFEAVRSA